VDFVAQYGHYMLIIHKRGSMVDLFRSSCSATQPGSFSCTHLKRNDAQPMEIEK